MQAQSTTASFRKLTPSMLASQQLAMANDIVKTTKAEVALALKKAAPALGITGTTYHILDILIGLTAADDWKQDHRPLVAISNEKLSEYVCRSTRTVTRSLKKLVEAGILSYRDSPTGRRYIHRDGPKNGKLGDIQRGFGLDFSPARQRVHELKEIGAAFAQKLQAQKDAKRTITRLTRSLKDLFELAQHEGISCSNMAKAHSNLQEKKFEVVSYAEALTALYECVQLEIHSKMSIAGDINALPYNHTNSQDSKNCNKIRKLSNDNTFNSKEPANGQKRALEKTIESNSSANESKLSPVSKINKSQSKLGISPLHGITLQLLQAACRLTQDT
ncbi:plasmid replication protein RepC, partial [Pseudovibrio ascidiaceicola]|uniref:plasmid replication protein RepC n=1 Tax=Pseudovibrio ascidiaceicola TaxID=285279 RepID=UPI003D36759D